MLGINLLLNTTAFNESSDNGSFGSISFLTGSCAENIILEEAPLVIAYLDSDCFTSETAFSDIQISYCFNLNSLSGEEFVLSSLISDPYYYHSNANNNLSFFCDYIAPSGNSNLVFPDTPCAAFASFDGYSGEKSLVIELLTADLYQFWDGTYADVDLTTYRLLNTISAVTGEYSVISISASAILSVISYSGELFSSSTIVIPPRADLTGDIFSGENFYSSLSISLVISPPGYSGENANAQLTPLQYADYIKSEGPSAYWKMDEQVGTSAHDYTGNNPDAVYTNGPTLGFTSPVASKYSVYLDGANDTVIGLPNVISNNLTQELWVKPDVSASITLYTPSSSGIQGNSGQRYAVWPYNNNSGSGGGISVGSNGIQVVAHGSGYIPILLSYQQPISTSSFTHILVSWNNRTPTLYVNGVAVATGYQARSPFQSQGLPSSGVYGYYKGYIQDVAIYPSALTAEQAREHYLAGLGYHFIPRIDAVDSYTGQYAEPFDIITDPHINFGIVDSIDGSSGQLDIQANVNLFPNAESGEIADLSGFILTPFVFFGITQAISGESLTAENLNTSVIFNILSYSDETSDFQVTTYPSSGLGQFDLYSGERYDLTLNVYSLIILNAGSGESGLADLLINAFDQIIGDAVSGETTNISLSTDSILDVSVISGQTSVLLLDTHPTIPLSVLGYSGEYTSPLVLITASVFSVPGYSGELNTVTFTTFAGEHLLIPMYSGSRGDASLATVYQLGASAYSDQYSDATLSVFYSTTLVATGYSDQYSLATLRTQDSLQPRLYSDQTAELVLTTSPSSLLTPLAYSGTRSDFDLLLGITFISNAQEGSTLFFTLSYIVNLGMLLPSFSGETAQVADMATAYNLPLFGYSGENGNVNLGVEYAIQINGYSGTRSYVNDFATNPPDLLSGIAYSGAYCPTLILSTRTVLPNLSYSGELLIAVIADNPAAPLLFNHYNGTNLVASLQTAIQIPVGRSYTGQWANVIGMSFEPNWYFVSGNHCEATLSTSHALPLTAYEGQRGIFEFSIHPSEPLGVFLFRYGEWMSPGLEVLYSTHFRVLYRTSIMTQVDIRSATYFDLTTDECCGIRPKSNNLNFFIERGMIPEEVGYGNRVHMDVNLRTNPRMKVEFSTGHVFEMIDRSAYFNITFGHESHQIDIDWYADLRHRLCKGYFIPTGDWVVVELQDILPEDCYADRFYGGETFYCGLSDDIVLRLSDNTDGSWLYADLITSPPWSLNAYTGEKMTFDFPYEAKHVHRTGEYLTIKFYEPPIIIITGSTLELDIQTEYGIRFLEDGCFDNEFVYQSNSGDMIPELFNPVPVEGEPYKHDIKGECF